MDEVSKTTEINVYAVLSELLSTVYNLTNLAAHLNEYERENTEPAEQIKKWLSILEYCETCLEMAVMSLPKIRSQSVNRLKWSIVTLVQLAKSSGRLMLLFKYDEGMLPHPPIQIKKSDNLYPERKLIPETFNTYLLKSGRRVRSVRPVYIQSNSDSEVVNDNESMKKFNNLELLAEAAYICKPIAHLGALYFSGRKSWKPWLLSLLIDITSLATLLNASIRGQLNKEENGRLLQRQIGLLVYLLRSPFYDRNTKQALEIVLYKLEMLIPCTSRFLVRPVLCYLPLLQHIYFYLWSH